MKTSRRISAVSCPPIRRPGARVLARVRVLAKKHEGRIAAIEPTSREIFIGDSVLDAARAGRRRFPGGTFYFVRIGYEAVDFQSGGIQKP